MLKFATGTLLSLILILFLAGLVGAESYLAGDLNDDYKVDWQDLQIFVQQWLDPPGCTGSGCADFDRVNGVDMADFCHLAKNWQAEEVHLVISEFMARNSSTLLDGDGESSDWIEIYNPTDVTVDLEGWYLTDDVNNRTRWAFPAGVEIDAGEFLVVFASGKNRLDPNELHTDFGLQASGEDLALVAPDGNTIVHKYEQYPQQLPDISYGLTQYARTLVQSGATVSYHVPNANDVGANWTALDFNDLAWHSGPTGLGFGLGGELRKAYNDCVYRDDQYIADNVTTYGIGNGFPGSTSGPLVDQFTGQDMGVAVEFTQSGGVTWQPDPTYGGHDCAAGTDARNTFGDIADMTGVIYYGSAGWWIDMSFTGLDPGTEYTVATSAARCGYTGRLTIYTLSGADTYANASTPGVDVLADNKVRFDTGDNNNEGYVARWSGIRASDGSFTVRAEADPSCPEGRKAYSFDVFMLEGGFSGSDLQSQMQSVNASLWTRAEFDLEEGEREIFEKLTLRMKYEDGFVAYLNGQEVARRNAPASVRWDSTATANRPIEDASVFESINLMAYRDVLQDGRNVLAIQGLNDNRDDGEFLVLPELTGASGSGIAQYCTTPTPGAFNVAGARGRVSEVWFSHSRGFYYNSFQLILSTDMDGAEIRYTTDGSRPTISHGNVYSAPIPINGTSVIRAVAVRPGWLDSEVETQTYMFIDDVITQSPNGEAPGPGWPTGSVNGQTINYGMDPDVVYDPRYASLIYDALVAIPTISLVTDLDNLFDSSIGIYVNAGREGRAWERPTSIELIHPDGTEGFQIDCGVRIRGGYSVSGDNPKHAFRLFFRTEYGEAKLKYPLFGDEGVDEFDHVDLRTSQNYSWAFGGDSRNTMVREVWSRDAQGETGHPYTRSRYYHLYINGHYWGLFQTQERSEASHGAAYMGGDKEDYDAINSNWSVGRAMYATDGNLEAYRRFYDAAMAGLTGVAYYHLQGLNDNGLPDPNYERMLDADGQVDFMAIEYFTGDRDGPGSRYGNIPNNTWGMYNRVNPDGWKWFHHDNEHTLGTGETDLVTPFTTAGAQWQYFNPHWLHEQLANNNIDYRQHFADHVHKHYANVGLLTPSVCQERIQRRASQIDMAIIAESARWGDSKRHPPYTKDDWQSAVNWILYSYLPSRTSTVLNQFETVGWFPTVDAPYFARYGGQVDKGFSMFMWSNSGTIYYTTDGTDPRVAAIQSSPGSTITLVPEAGIKRVLVPSGPVGGTAGSILREYWIGIGGTEVSALTSSPDYPGNPTGRDLPTSFEAPTDWADNYGTLVRGYLHPLAGGDYTFWVASDDSSELWLSADANPANKVRIAHVPGWTNSREWNKYAEQQSAPISLTSGQKYYIEALHKEGSGGDNLAVAWQGPGISQAVIGGQYLSPAGDTWATIYFDDSNWTIGVGGVGYEKEPGDIINFTGLFGTDVDTRMYGVNTTCYIRIPFVYSGSPSNLSSMTLRVRYDDGFIAYINGTEVARRNFTGAPQWDSAATSEHPDAQAINFEDIDISGFINALRSGDNMLAIHGLNISATSPDFLISVEVVAGEIGQGDVSPAASVFTDAITLNESTDVKARVLDGSTWSALTEATFAVGPVVDNLRITEIMYHPEYAGDANDPNKEFVELKNIGPDTLNLNLASFTDGISFTFPSLELLSGEYVVVVKDRSAFEAEYGAGINIAGEYTGSLSNAGEHIRLEDAAGQTIHDFEYKDGWREITDGDGFSLTIIDATTADTNSWSERDSWRASAYAGGSPGSDDSGIIPNPGAIVINEVMAHSHLLPDWIELHNTTDAQINIGGWYLSEGGGDDANLTKYRIADGTTIDGNKYAVFYENVHFGNPSDPGCNEVFALSENGEQIYLSSGQAGVLTGYREVEDFGASETGVSFGRYFKSSTGNYNFVAMDHNTPDAANGYPKVGPVVINEIMYNPGTGNQNEEYVELYNITDQPVTLYDSVEGMPWRFTDGIDYTFPSSPAVTIPAQGYLLVVKKPAVFSLRYPTVPAEKILGPYDGRLSNGGETLELSKPGDVDALGKRYYIRVDRVKYSDGSHSENCPGGVDLWPTGADGQGFSLTRKVTKDYGNDVANWWGFFPTPGQ